MEMPKEDNAKNEKSLPHNGNLTVHRHLIIIGNEGSGKSTIFKQLKQINGQDSEPDRLQMKETIRKYVVDTINRLLVLMPTLWPPLQLDNLQNVIMAKSIRYYSKNWKFFDFTEKYQVRNLPDFFNLPQFIKSLWQDQAVQSSWKKSDIYRKSYNITYFIDKIDTIFKADYLPTHEDILRYPEKPSTVSEELISCHKFRTTDDYFNYKVIDVGSCEKSQDRWMAEMVTRYNDGFLFVIDCSSYDVLSKEEPPRNQLKESLTMLEEVLQKFRRRNAILVLLNKQDQLRDKISNDIKFGDYFKDFENVEDNGTDTVDRVNRFIISQIQEIFIRTRQMPDNRNYFPFHLICAFNEDDVRQIIEKLFSTRRRFGCLLY